MMQFGDSVPQNQGSYFPVDGLPHSKPSPLSGFALLLEPIRPGFAAGPVLSLPQGSAQHLVHGLELDSPNCVLLQGPIDAGLAGSNFLRLDHCF